MSLGLWPEAVPFDPDSESALNELRKHFDAAALPGAILLVPARNMRDSPWAPRAAIGLARAMAADRTIVLVDLDFEHPVLHTVVGEANGEGVADALLFGASLERVTIHPAGQPFEFVPAGAYAPEPEELMAHPGWTRVLAELGARRALLLAWAPLGARGLDSLADRIAPVIVLAEESDVTQTVALLPESIRIEGVIRPGPAAQPAAPPPAEPVPSVPEPSRTQAPPAFTPEVGPRPPESVPAPPPEPPPEPTRHAKEEAREALMAELRARQQASAPEPPDDGPAATAAAPPSGPAGDARRRFVTLFAIVAGLSIVAWFIGRLLAGGGEPPPQGGVATARDGTVQPAGEILGYSIAIESYDRLTAAMARADSLGSAEPGVTFYIAPFALDSVKFYRVLAGPLVDSVSATATMQGLVDRGLKTAASMDDVRSTPLAFELGRFDSREEAVQQMNRVKAQGIPSYVVEVPYTEGPPRFHLYAGAYSGPTEAAMMRDVLRGAGIMDTLVLRVGRNSP